MTHQVNIHHEPTAVQSPPYDEDEVEAIDDKDLPFLKYDPEFIEIKPQEYIPPEPWYKRDTSNYFYPQYDAASFVSTHRQTEHGHHHHRRHQQQHHELSTSRVHIIAAGKATGKKNQEMLDVLDYCLPPQDFKDDNEKYFRHKVSGILPKLPEVKALVEEVENRLESRNARETGYCPIRRAIFTDLFDEVIRQVIIDNPVKGILLVRIRDEVLVTFSCYRFLIQNIQAYGNRKETQAEMFRKQLEELNGDQNTEIIELRKRHASMLFQLRENDMKYRQMREADMKKRKEDIDFQKSITRQLNQQMERMNVKGGFR